MNALHRHSKWCTSMIACNNQGDDDADDEGDNNREQEESSQGGWAGAAGREPVSERMSEHASACLLACLGGLVTCMLKWSERRGRLQRGYV